MKTTFRFREKISADDAWITEVATKLWGSVEIVSRDRIYNILQLANFVGLEKNKPVGFVMYADEGENCEIVAIYSELQNKGLGTQFINLVKEAVRKSKCKKVWLMTTNDNTQALRFYQKRGFVISAIKINEMENQRKLKPIPEYGNDGIPIRDEIELEYIL